VSSWSNGDQETGPIKHAALSAWHAQSRLMDVAQGIAGQLLHCSSFGRFRIAAPGRSVKTDSTAKTIAGVLALPEKA
jgi:hypothetical protein